MGEIKGLLAGIKVADLSGVFGAYAGRLLADHGATVVRIGPDKGDCADAIGPFDPDDASSYFAKFVNAGKYSVSVSIDRLSEPDFLRGVLDWADIVIEELPVLTGDDKAELPSNGDTVCVRIRPYPEGSAHSTYRLDDLAAQAVGGLMSLTGNPDREPLALFGGQAYYIVGVFAATAALLGLNDSGSADGTRKYTVTILEAIVNSLETAVQYYTTEGVVRGRKGAAQQAGDGSYRAKDGNVVLGAMTDLEWGRLSAWLGRMDVEQADDFAKWKLEDRRDPQRIRLFAETFEKMARQYSTEELTNAGQNNRVLVSPSYTLTQILGDPQLTYDQFFRNVSDKQGRNWVFPGAPYQISSGAVMVRERLRKSGEDTEWFLRDCLGDPQFRQVL